MYLSSIVYHKCQSWVVLSVIQPGGLSGERELSPWPSFSHEQIPAWKLWGRGSNKSKGKWNFVCVKASWPLWAKVRLKNLAGRNQIFSSFLIKEITKTENKNPFEWLRASTIIQCLHSFFSPECFFNFPLFLNSWDSFLKTLTESLNPMPSLAQTFPALAHCSPRSDTWHGKSLCNH